MECIITPYGKYISNKNDIIEVVGPIESDSKHYQPVSKFLIIVRCENHEYTFGYDCESDALKDIIFLDSI